MSSRTDQSARDRSVLSARDRSVHRADPLPVRAFIEQIMGLPISLHLRDATGRGGPDRHTMDRRDVLARTVFGLLRRVDGIFSPWRADSELLRHRRGLLRWNEVHPWMHEIRDWCEEAKEVTSGLFTDRLTGPDGSIGWDPTGLVKGWSVDLACALLDQAGYGYALGAGGDIRCGAGYLGTTAWSIGVEDPFDTTRLLGSLQIARGSIATSGTAARGAHIVDPRTGKATGTTGAVTVTGPELMWADVWATASFLDPLALSRQESFLARGYRVSATALRGDPDPVGSVRVMSAISAP